MRLNTLVTGIQGIPPINSTGTSTVNLLVGRRYHALLLQFMVAGVLATQAEIEACVSEVRLIVNGKLMRRFSAADAYKILGLNGIGFNAGFLPIYFSEPNRASVMDEELTSWDLKDENSFTLEIDMTVGAAAIVWSGVMVYDYLRNVNPQTQQPFKQIVKWLKQGFNLGSGEVDIDNLPKSNPIQRIHIFTAEATRVRVKSDSIDVYDETSEQNEARLAAYGLVQQADTLPAVFDYTQQLSDYLPVVGKDGTLLNDLNVKVTMANAANNVTFITEATSPNFN